MSWLFVPDVEINGNEYADIPFIRFHHYENISSCYLHNHILPDHGKTCSSCMNLESVDEVKVETWKILVLKSYSFFFTQNITYQKLKI